MKRFQSIFAILLSLFFSCVSEKVVPWSDISEFDCADNNRQKAYYVVDSICIASPIIVVAKDGTEFVMSTTVFKKYNGKNSFFYTQPDVYFLESIAFGTFSYKKWPHGLEDCWNYSEPDFKNKYRLETYHFKKKPDYFIFSLVSGDYASNIPFDSGRKELKLKNLKFSYYKVVFPVCKLAN
jgi:hypothetical protein